MQQAFYGGQSPWQYEALFINRSKLVVSTTGRALSREMAEMSYTVDYYVHVETKEDALLIVQHLPYSDHRLTTKELNTYAGPVIEQAINQIVQVTPLEMVNEKIGEINAMIGQHLREFLAPLGIHLDTVKLLIMPADERMKTLIALRAFGLTDLEAVRHYIALVMAENGIVSAPNMAIGAPYHVGMIPPGAGGAHAGLPALSTTVG